MYDAVGVPPQVVCPDVILIGYDSLISDVAQLQEVEWEVVVLDERECAASTLSKAHQALREMNCIHKLLLSPSLPARVGVLFTPYTWAGSVCLWLVGGFILLGCRLQMHSSRQASDVHDLPV